MASASMQGSEEEARLICDYQRYRSNAQHHLGQSQKALRAITMVAGKTQESPQLRMA
jgi:hypothetical protein